MITPILVLLAATPWEAPRSPLPSPALPAVSDVVPRGFRAALAEASSLGVPSVVLARLACSESSWRPRLVVGPNSDGSYDLGLMGWNSRHLAEHQAKVGGFDPMNPGEALAAAARWLVILKGDLGSWERAVVAWKSGWGRAASHREPAWVRVLAGEIVKGVEGNGKNSPLPTSSSRPTRGPR